MAATPEGQASVFCLKKTKSQDVAGIPRLLTKQGQIKRPIRSPKVSLFIVDYLL